MEHTKGKVKIGDANLPKYAYYGIHGEKYIICDICNDGYDEDQQNANANLIIDAFNTTNESGLTPSQLYKQNQELLDFLIDLRNGDYVYINNATFKKADELINNAKTK